MQRIRIASRDCHVVHVLRGRLSDEAAIANIDRASVRNTSSSKVREVRGRRVRLTGGSIAFSWAGDGAGEGGGARCACGRFCEEKRKMGDPETRNSFGAPRGYNLQRETFLREAGRGKMGPARGCRAASVPFRCDLARFRRQETTCRDNDVRDKSEYKPRRNASRSFNAPLHNAGNNAGNGNNLLICTYVCAYV